MQKRKSVRHVAAANARWRAAEMRAHADRETGIPDMPLLVEFRVTFGRGMLAKIRAAVDGAPPMSAWAGVR